MKRCVLIAVRDVDLSYATPEFSRGIKLTPIPLWVREDDDLKKHFSFISDALNDRCAALALEYERDEEYPPGEFQSQRSHLIEAYMAMLIAGYPVGDFFLLVDAKQSVDGGDIQDSASWDIHLMAHLISWCSHDVKVPEDNGREVAQLASRLDTGVSSISSDSPLRIALESATLALGARNNSMRFLTLWTGLEAILGATDRGEISHQIAERAAWLLESDIDSRLLLYRNVKKSYGLRSAISHGGKPDPAEMADFGLHFAETTLYASLRHVLLNGELIQAFSKPNTKDDYFKKLILGG